MAHIIILDGIAKTAIDTTDALSTVEANIARGYYTSQTTPTLAAVNTAKDNLMDYLNDTNSDFQGNLAAFKTACGCQIFEMTEPMIIALIVAGGSVIGIIVNSGTTLLAAYLAHRNHKEHEGVSQQTNNSVMKMEKAMHGTDN